MGFDRFHWQLIIRLLLGWALGIGGLYLVFLTEFWLAGGWLLFFAVLSLVSLIRFTSKYRRDLANFLEAIRQRDFSQTLNVDAGSRAEKELKRAYMDILKVFRDLSRDRESQHHFLQAILSEVPVALAVISTNGSISLYNPAFLVLVSKKQVRNLSSIVHLPNGLLEVIKTIKPGESALPRVSMGGRPQVLSIRCTGLSVAGKDYRILTFQDIRMELDEKELDAWQKLIRVLTHEIMNSAIPVATLTSVTRNLVEAKGQESFSSEEINDLLRSLRTIENRSKGLAGFVDAYRSLTNIRPPEFSSFPVRELMEETIQLFKEETYKINANVLIQVIPDDLTILADRALLGQVLVNLFKNAMDAVVDSTEPTIILEAVRSGNKIVVAVSDNGTGIDEDIIDHLFIPFYTTKKTGSGIGLSLSRQIVRLHGGTLTVNSESGQGSRFEIVI